MSTSASAQQSLIKVAPTLFLILATIALTYTERASADNLTWDGGGLTNNWSEPANWSGDTVPTSNDIAIFNGTSVKDAVIDVGIVIRGVQINAGYTGTLTQSAGTNITIGSSGYTQSSGTFSGGDANININGTFTLSGGAFSATSGTMSTVRFNTLGGTFAHNGGTVVFVGDSVDNFVDISPIFNNLVIDKSNNAFFTLSGGLVVNGSLTFSNGNYLSGGSITANGSVTFGPGFDGGGGQLVIAGSALRTITLDAGTLLLPVTVNSPNVSINTSLGGGDLNWQTITLQNGTINQGDVNFAVSGSYSQSGGTFNGGSGNVDLNGAFNLAGGTFKAPSGTLFVGSSYTHIAGGTFDHNNGTVVMDGSSGQINVSPPDILNNFTYSMVHGTGRDMLGTLIVSGNTTLNDGLLFFGPLEARGDVAVTSTFDGGGASIKYTGTANQTFTNSGGTNLSGSWTIDKPSGTVTAASSIIHVGGQPFNITSGTLYLNAGSDLTVGPLNIGTGGRLVNDSSTTITLGADPVNNGAVDLQGGGAACPEADSILLRSSVNGTRRNWSGSGVYRLVDVDVRDMGGINATTPAVTVFSGTSSGNNNSNWTFNGNCPQNLSISPQIALIATGATQQFTSGGGFQPHTFSLAANPSGASINAATGLYTAGATGSTADTVRVTDAFGGIADATVNVFFPPAQLAFTVQPSDTTAGQTIAPPIRVAVQDQFGSTVTHATNAVTITILNNPGGGTLSGTVTRNAVNGIATFDDLSMVRAGDGYTFQVASGGLTSATSNSFNIIPGPPVQIGFITQPSNTQGLSPITPPVQVSVQDSFGNTVNTSTGVITVDTFHNPIGATLSGTLVRTLVNGVATFDDLSLNGVANNFTLQANAGGLPQVISNFFNVTRPVFLVTNTSDSGLGSLRQAITDANTLIGVDTINFNIPGTAPFTITPLVPLPAISREVIIDGSTQPGFSGTPVVEVRGTNNIGNGLEILPNFDAGGSTIRSLVINGWQTGIFIDGNSTAGENVVEGCFIGTDVTGTLAVPNSQGIRVLFSNGNKIGGVTAGQRNVISGNLGPGITLSSSSNTIIKGNRIGTRSDGTSPLPNLTDGVTFAGTNSNGNVIGGIEPGAGNVIAFNAFNGIGFFSQSAVSSPIRGNAIFSNSHLGIATMTGSQTGQPRPNDPGDRDGGANSGQNYPVLSTAISTGGNTTIDATLNSIPQTAFVLDFYTNQACDPSGHGEGETYIGSVNLSTNVDGILRFNASLPVSTTIGHFLTATATSINAFGTLENTSEFSRCVRITDVPVSISGRARDAINAPLANSIVRLSGTKTRTTTTDSNGNYSFTGLPSGGDYTVTVTRANHDFTPPSRTYSNLTTDRTSQDFTGIKTRFIIVGQLLGVINNTTVPLSGVDVTLSGTAAGTTVANGIYFFSELSPGQYTVTPSKDGFVFSPPSMTVNVTNSDVGASFNATPSSPLEGRIIHSSSGFVAGINADGTASNVFLSTRIASGPSFSRDGRRFAYTKTFSQTNLPIFTSNADGSGDTPLGLPPGQNSFASWSPDGSRIVFVRVESGVRTLWVVNATGDGEVEVPVANVTQFRSPTWLNNSRLVFCGFDGNDFEIYSVNLDGSGLFKMTNNSVSDENPAASPDGTKIAFTRAATPSATPKDLVTFNFNGSGLAIIRNDIVGALAWSPDNARIVFNQLLANGTQRAVAVDSATGGGQRVINGLGFVTAPSWGPRYAFSTPVGANVSVIAGGSSVTFANVTNAGTTTFTPLSANTLGAAPSGFVLRDQAYDISTTAAYTAPVDVCFKVQNQIVNTSAAFNALSLMHIEGGVFVDKTTTRDFTTRNICGTVTTIDGPFVLAAQQNATGANGVTLASITGVIVDSVGNPMSYVPVQLTGTEVQTTETDVFGNFSFVNLTSGGNYNVQPKQPGYIFSEYSEDFIGITGEVTAAFIGTQGSFSISGRITDSSGIGMVGITVELAGAADQFAATDINGDYTFAGVPADGSYTVTPISAHPFDPPSNNIDPLTSDVSGFDFVLLAPTAASVSVGGRVMTSDGHGIKNVSVTITNSSGQRISARTNPFGYYRFDNIPVGSVYIISARHRQYSFTDRAILVQDELTDIHLLALGPSP